MTFRLWDFSLRYYLDWSQSWSLYKVHHLWNMIWLKLVDVFIRLSLIKLMSRSIPLNGFLPMTAVPQRPRWVRHNIFSTWIVDGADLYSCLILNYMNIISALFHFTIDSSRFLESLSSSITLCTSYDLAVLLVSIVSIHSLQLVNYAVGDEQKKRLLFRLHLTPSTGASNTKCPIHHLASSCISSPMEIASLLPRKISASISLLDSVLQNLRDSIAILLSMSSQSQCSSRRLSINCDTWAKH